MGSDTELVNKRAPTLYAIIVIKLVKGLLFLTLAIVAYTLSDNDLRKRVETSRRSLMRTQLRRDPFLIGKMAPGVGLEPTTR